MAALGAGSRTPTRKSGPAATRLPARGRVAIFLGAAAATVAWALTIGPWMKAAMPWRDAFIAAFSVAAQVLQVRKHIENWAVWVVVNLVAVASYGSADLAFTAFLYAIYLGLALAGWSTGLIGVILTLTLVNIGISSAKPPRLVCPS